MMLMFSYVGFIFFIVDTVLWIKKKRLAYPFKYKLFLLKEDIQAEMEMEACNEIVRALESDDAMTKIQRLKEMKDNGVINEEEFNTKKVELMAKI